MPTFLPRSLPPGLEALTDLALNLHWTWSHGSDALWKMLDQAGWEHTENPWMLLQNASSQRLQQLAKDTPFCKELERLNAEHAAYQADRGWYGEAQENVNIGQLAYFSMEFGLGEALPIYAGGLGILAGDYLKTSSDLGLPTVGVGLLYQEGYFRQMIDADGEQLAIYPYNEPSTLPIQPVRLANGEWLHIPLKLPGRQLMLRAWQVSVGRVQLYLLDSNDPLNSPRDRGITNKLYGGGKELRFLQEMVLGIGGWRLLEAMGNNISVCHLNEGHAAFVILERARHCMEHNKLSFDEALWMTRAGNIFTTHTPVEAGFDTFPAQFIDKYFPIFHAFLIRTGLSLQQLLALGRKNADDPTEAFNMAYLAMRGCARSNAVSRLHGEVSRQLFSSLFPYWPISEVPVGHVTNGVHMPSWDSSWADQLWTETCGKQRWLGSTESLHQTIQSIDDSTLWRLRANEREDLIHYARQRLALQLGQVGATPKRVESASQTLDPNVLTLGFARRFATYKRPNLLLHDKTRLKRLLRDKNKPVQLIIAGKAHPDDAESQRMIQEWILFVNQPDIRGHVVFLEDYDIALAQHLVQGIDVWINTPRRPWEACGTSGMKILANGGLNLSELDGWWAEACTCNVGWSIGDGKEHDADPDWDVTEAEQLYQRLENEIIPLFYARDTQGLPRDWLNLIRNSMMKLAPQFSSNRMVREYVEQFYYPAATDYKNRCANQGRLAKQLHNWHDTLTLHWDQIHFGNVDAQKINNGWSFQVQVYLGEILPDQIQVELYAEGIEDNNPLVIKCHFKEKITGAIHGCAYQVDIETTRLATDFTARVIPHNIEVQVPAEANLIVWQR
ncbi:maltodextrin phosphorylase [bacterium BMS3Bbin11]|nr:maltodextrin phosphorylase [bacterium BMS3Abin11]GBE46169.1 maltodextrin phosphorylase [bacterium BMS3Bbin11]GMT41329.1 MAG: alpha-glucan phosphorylase [bacterium]HDH08734.1 alpha-glucan family phosphorylase [Gammaproteobacteria bacterium]HDH16323.1 alpha-glucan family phosphorylase [Gammaproteobacteria bacterium]